MSDRRRRIGILTGGGDCPGLNAVIRGSVKTAVNLGYEVVGFLRGFEGLVDPVATMQLDLVNTFGILTKAAPFWARPIAVDSQPK